MNIKKLIEEISAIAEEEMIDEFDDTQISDTQLEPSIETNTTEQLDAKTKISRALDVLKKAIEDFKDSTVEEIDLIADSNLMQNIETLDNNVKTIEQTLNGESKDDKVEDIEIEDIEQIEDEDENNEEVEEETNFDDEASLDLFTDEEE